MMTLLMRVTLVVNLPEKYWSRVQEVFNNLIAERKPELIAFNDFYRYQMICDQRGTLGKPVAYLGLANERVHYSLMFMLPNKTHMYITK